MLLPRTHTNVLGENRMAENIVNVMLNFSKKKKEEKMLVFSSLQIHKFRFGKWKDCP